ncbi:alpha-L-fucosidase [Paenibacillus roseipurpureus]|uniref:alpha-L-fucosidase n=1 Tax=Paenibacillus roseopurpureus TaxID=2918901 RepID=A0AA96RLL6_9BACL|nr:alpha-L-fucosidase [Paenibacillus sp. MBLB1832]WNR45546.1 alpha-L-fucosidase [Paenibacillus sp. MBLB1832]
MHKQRSDDVYEQRLERIKWFRDARFGMFIHWGLYAIPARGEWVRSMERMSIEDYQTYFDEFDPLRYQPRVWAQLAKEAGMKYAVLTAKHHDGFCLFDSQYTEYKATNTPAKRDLVREFVEAFREEGLKVGLYYSLLDWHHPDYPAYGDRQHPMRDHPDYREVQHEFPRYVDYMHAQVEELLSGYGRIDIMWFDFSYPGFSGEAWRATELVNKVRALQPHILIDNRLGGDMHAEHPVAYAGDFAGPEQGVPRHPVTDELARRLPWESCITLNNSWGYHAQDWRYKTAQDVIRTLVNCVSKNGNLLVNVSPTAKGEIPQKAQSILREVGEWLLRNGESIYGCGEAVDQPKPEWGRYTQREHILYAHLMEQVIGHVSLEGLRGKIKKARVLADGSEVVITPFWNVAVDSFDGPDDIFMNFGYPAQETYPLPDPRDTVIALELKQV